MLTAYVCQSDNIWFADRELGTMYLILIANKYRILNWGNLDWMYFETYKTVFEYRLHPISIFLLATAIQVTNRCNVLPKQCISSPWVKQAFVHKRQLETNKNTPCTLCSRWTSSYLAINKTDKWQRWLKKGTIFSNSSEWSIYASLAFATRPTQPITLASKRAIIVTKTDQDLSCVFT